MRTDTLCYLSRFSKARILVVGDVMLDRYLMGSVERISPEAPVPVVQVQQEDNRPGGAANVARNIAHLGAQVSLLGIVGHDENGRILTKLIKDDGIDAHLCRDKQSPTTVKLRVLGQQQQLLRLDFENTPHHDIYDEKMKHFEACLPQCDVVVFSDYDKGALSHIALLIEKARRADKTVVVDPKGGDYQKYTGASVITPNRNELRSVVGSWKEEAELIAKAKLLKQKMALEALLITRSEEGMTLLHKDQVHHDAAKSQEVYDVSGAGDTVVATLAIFLALSADWVSAVHAANVAAGCVVKKRGTATLGQDELKQALQT